MGSPVEDSGVVGHVLPDVGNFLPGASSGGANLWIGYFGDVSKYWEDAGQISPPGDTNIVGEASETADGK